MTNRYSIIDGKTVDQYGRVFTPESFSRRKRGRPKKVVIKRKRGRPRKVLEEVQTVREFERGCRRTVYVKLEASDG